MKKQYKLVFAIFSLSLLFLSCKKTKNTTASCDACNQVNNTVFFALDWPGKMSYNSQVNKWTVLYTIPNTIDGKRVCILCRDIPDSLKVTGKTAIFSGEIKETCAILNPQIGGQETYSVNPSIIK